MSMKKLIEVFAESLKLEDIIYKFNTDVPPCFYDFVIHLNKEKQLKIKRFKLPKLSTEKYWEIRKQTSPGQRHYEYQVPMICYALHQRGYKYSEINSEGVFSGSRPDLLAVPCKDWYDCRAREKLCKNCDEGNGLGFIVVEVGSLTFLSKIFLTRKSRNIDEFWLVPDDDYVYVFIAKRGEHKAWNWNVERVKKIIEQDFKKDGCLNIIRGYGCSAYPNCTVDYDEKLCRLEIQKRIKKE